MIKVIHESMIPAGSKDDGTSSHQETISAGPRREKHVIRYRILQEKLEKTPVYKPVELASYTPRDHYEKHQYIKELKLPFNIHLNSYSYGNYLGALSFVWRLPDDMTELDTKCMKDAISSIDLKNFHARARRQAFFER